MRRVKKPQLEFSAASYLFGYNSAVIEHGLREDVEDIGCGNTEKGTLIYVDMGKPSSSFLSKGFPGVSCLMERKKQNTGSNSSLMFSKEFQ